MLVVSFGQMPYTILMSSKVSSSKETNVGQHRTSAKTNPARGYRIDWRRAIYGRVDGNGLVFAKTTICFSCDI
jgi:hypothetical protein